MDQRHPPNRYNEYLRRLDTIEDQRKAYIAETTKRLLGNPRKTLQAPPQYVGGIATQMGDLSASTIDAAIQRSIYTAYGITRPAPDGAFNRGITFDHINERSFAARHGF